MNDEKLCNDILLHIGTHFGSPHRILLRISSRYSKVLSKSLFGFKWLCERILWISNLWRRWYAKGISMIAHRELQRVTWEVTGEQGVRVNYLIKEWGNSCSPIIRERTSRANYFSLLIIKITHSWKLKEKPM